MSVDFHLQLQQTSFKIPLELAKKNLKSVQKLLERQKKQALADLNKITGTQAGVRLTKEEQQAALSALIASFEVFQAKLREKWAVASELMDRLQARQARYAELTHLLSPERDSEASALGLERWHRDQLNLLVVDYLLKSAPDGSGIGLEILDAITLTNPSLKKLIDYDVYGQYRKIYTSIVEGHDLTLLSQWVQEHKLTLKKLVYQARETPKHVVEYGSSLEFELKFQEFLNIVRNTGVIEGIAFCKQALSLYMDISTYAHPHNYHQNIKRITHIGGILLCKSMQAEPMDTLEPDETTPSFVRSYITLYSQDRWVELAKVFTQDFFHLFGISRAHPLLVLLSAGLCSLKTKSCSGCHVEYVTAATSDGASSPADVAMDPEATAPASGSHEKVNACPVCSSELFGLTQNLPYAHLVTSSIISGNPIMLPNGNIYDEEKLFGIQEKLRARDPQSLKLEETQAEPDLRVYDPLTGESFGMDQIEKAYPT